MRCHRQSSALSSSLLAQGQSLLAKVFDKFVPMSWKNVDVFFFSFDLVLHFSATVVTVGLLGPLRLRRRRAEGVVVAGAADVQLVEAD